MGRTTSYGQEDTPQSILASPDSDTSGWNESTLRIDDLREEWYQEMTAHAECAKSPCPAHTAYAQAVESLGKLQEQHSARQVAGISEPSHLAWLRITIDKWFLLSGSGPYKDPEHNYHLAIRRCALALWTRCSVISKQEQ